MALRTRAAIGLPGAPIPLASAALDRVLARIIESATAVLGAASPVFELVAPFAVQHEDREHERQQDRPSDAEGPEQRER